MNNNKYKGDINRIKYNKKSKKYIVNTNKRTKKQKGGLYDDKRYVKRSEQELNERLIKKIQLTNYYDPDIDIYYGLGPPPTDTSDCCIL